MKTHSFPTSVPRKAHQERPLVVVSQSRCFWRKHGRNHRPISEFHLGVGGVSGVVWWLWQVFLVSVMTNQTKSAEQGAVCRLPRPFYLPVWVRSWTRLLSFDTVFISQSIISYRGLCSCNDSQIENASGSFQPIHGSPSMCPSSNWTAICSTLGPLFHPLRAAVRSLLD